MSTTVGNAVGGGQDHSRVDAALEEGEGPTLVERVGAFAVAFTRWIEASTEGGLSYPRLRLLGQLHCGGPAIMRELGDQLALTPRNMTALVDALEAEGLVRRVPHPSDRRAVLVEATPAGIDVASSALRPRLDAIGAVFEVLSPDERDRFAEMIDRLMAELLSRREAGARPTS